MTYVVNFCAGEGGGYYEAYVFLEGGSLGGGVCGVKKKKKTDVVVFG